VFCPKYRRKVLVAPIDERLQTIIMETIEKWGQELIELEVIPDHVHVLVGCDPQFGIHRLVKYIKGTSSRYLRQEFPQLKRKLPSLWTNTYFVATVGGVTLETLKHYVEGQKVYEEGVQVQTLSDLEARAAVLLDAYPLS
jgi:putative transposase